MLLEKELEAVGIRLNKRPPNIYFKRKTGGGVKFTHTVPLTHCHEKLIMTILHEYKIFNADVVFRENCTYVILFFIKAIFGGKKKFLKDYEFFVAIFLLKSKKIEIF